MNECDHIVGIEEYTDDEGWDGFGWDYINQSTGYEDKSNNHDYFKFCPECGAKLYERV